MDSSFVVEMMRAFVRAVVVVGVVSTLAAGACGYCASRGCDGMPRVRVEWKR